MTDVDWHFSSFVAQASSKDAGQLAAALHHRILALKSRAEQEPESAPPGPEPEVPQSNEDDSDDEPKGAVGATANTSGKSTFTHPPGIQPFSGRVLRLVSDLVTLSLPAGTSEGGEAQEAGGT